MKPTAVCPNLTLQTLSSSKYRERKAKFCVRQVRQKSAVRSQNIAFYFASVRPLHITCTELRTAYAMTVTLTVLQKTRIEMSKAVRQTDDAKNTPQIQMCKGSLRTYSARGDDTCSICISVWWLQRKEPTKDDPCPPYKHSADGQLHQSIIHMPQYRDLRLMTSDIEELLWAVRVSFTAEGLL